MRPFLPVVCAVGGQDKIRALWQHYYNNTDALIWIVDSCDSSRLAEARDEMHHVVANDALRNAAVLVFANKQDLPGAVKADKLAGGLGLHSLRQQEWYIQPCSAATGDGLIEGLEWLHKTLRSNAAARARRG